MSFSINCLEITHPSSIQKKTAYDKLYKNLTSRFYLFNDYYAIINDSLVRNKKSNFKKNKDFFSKKVNIQAIVGMNGSGKSSLMDLMYMAINNFAFMLECDSKRKNNWDFVYFVPNLWVNLYFSIDSNDFVLECKDDTIILSKNNFQEKIIHYHIDYKKRKFAKQSDNALGLNQIIKENFFFSIISNFSLQSFIPSCYEQNVFYHFSAYSKRKAEITYGKKSWITQISHKNDGYFCPIVLNPNHGYGIVDLDREIKLSKERFASILIYDTYLKRINNNSVSKKIFEIKYEFNDLKISYNRNFVAKKLCEINGVKNISKKRFDFSLTTDRNVVIFFREELKKDKDGFYKTVCRYFSLSISETSPDMKILAFAYLCCKLILITKSNQQYSRFQDSFGISESNGLYIKRERENLFRHFLRDIRIDLSHTTKKIRRTINFLRIREEHFPTDKEFSFIESGCEYITRICENSHQKFSFAGNRNHVAFKPMETAIINRHTAKLPSTAFAIDDCLPPSFFIYDVLLEKTSNNQTEQISYSQLSSGELQLLQTLSTHMYHAQNLISIVVDNQNRRRLDQRLKDSILDNKNELSRGTRVEYRNINLIFDETEICFHPEYQRMFVKRLLDMIEMLEITKYCSLNITIMTHSPFILSDFPMGNVLYLKDGKMNCEKERQNTFAQNISVLLNQDFFLENFIGAFAKEKVNGIIDRVLENKTLSLYEKKRLTSLASSVGDELIQNLLLEKIKRR